MRVEQCLVNRCSFQTGCCSSKMITLGSGTDPNIAVLCSNHLDYVDRFSNFWERRISEIASFAGYKSRIADNTLYRFEDYLKEQYQKAKDKELWLEMFNDSEEKLNSFKKCLVKWIKAVSERTNHV